MVNFSRFICCILFFSSFVSVSHLEAAYRKVNGQWVKDRYLPYIELSDHLKLAQDFYKQGEDAMALHQLLIVTKNSQNYHQLATAYFLMAKIYLVMENYEEANSALNRYLSESIGDEIAFEVWDLKFEIAEHFRLGGKKRVFGFENLPKWLSGKGLAVQIYDEIIQGVPRSSIARKSYISKALVLRAQRRFEESNEALLYLTTHCPTSAEGYAAFIELSTNYLLQMESHSRDEHDLYYAQLNIKKFMQNYPGAADTPLQENYSQMEELLAQRFFDIGCLYEKKDKRNASRIYFQKVISSFPQSHSARLAQLRLQSHGEG